MPPKRKAAPKKKEESPPPSESEPESEPEYEEEEEEEEPESPKPKKSKPGPKPKAAPKAKVAPAPSPKKQPAKAAPPKKQPAKKGAKAEVVAEKPAPAVQKSAPKPASKQVVIEHCKQCQSFKRTATKLEGLLKKSIPDLEVTMNPEKPRKGIFEVRDGEGNTFISLQGLVRPFKKMKDLDLEEAADNVVAKLT